MANTIRIHNEIRRLIPPLRPEELAALEASLKAEGCRHALVLWKSVNILLDGHNRYEIRQRERIPFKTLELELADRFADLAGKTLMAVWSSASNSPKGDRSSCQMEIF